MFLHKVFYTKNVVQWGSEIRTSLEFEWYKRGWLANDPDFKWDLKSWIPIVWNPDKWLPFCQKPFGIWTKMSGFQMVRFQILTVYKLPLKSVSYGVGFTSNWASLITFLATANLDLFLGQDSPSSSITVFSLSRVFEDTFF